MNTIIYTLIAFNILFICTSCLSPKKFDEKQWHKQVNTTDPKLLYAEHLRDGKYFNPWNRRKTAFSDFLRWRFSKNSREYTGESNVLPEVLPDPVKRIRALGNDDFIMWIGHNTFLVRLRGIYWITDPIFTKRAVVPKRKTPPAMTVKQLLSLTDTVTILITHNHYDHLDEESMETFPKQCPVYVPAGLEKAVREMNKVDVTALDWWDETKSPRNIKLTCLPAQHWSRRITQGENRSLWASYLLETPEVKIYIGGDSGYFIGYREFGRTFKGIDYALMPVTAFHPRWFMHYAHMDVNESIMAFKELGARYFIPTQWGTFHLGEEPPGHGIIELKKAIDTQKLDPASFIVPDIGGIVRLTKN